MIGISRPLVEVSAQVRKKYDSELITFTEEDSTSYRSGGGELFVGYQRERAESVDCLDCFRAIY